MTDWTVVLPKPEPTRRKAALLWRVAFLLSFAVLSAWGNWTQWVAILMSALSLFSALLLWHRSRFSRLPLYALTTYFLCATLIDGIYYYVNDPALLQQPIRLQIISWLIPGIIAAVLVNCCLYSRFLAHDALAVAKEDTRSATRALLARVAGGVLLVFGTGLAILAIWILERQLALRGALQLNASAMLLGFSLIAVFCFLVGYRLFVQRPNRYGSILPPSGWMALASCLFATGAALGGTAIWHSRYQLLSLPAFLGLLGCACIVASRTAKRRATVVAR